MSATRASNASAFPLLSLPGSSRSAEKHICTPTTVSSTAPVRKHLRKLYLFIYTGIENWNNGKHHRRGHYAVIAKTLKRGPLRREKKERAAEGPCAKQNARSGEVRAEAYREDPDQSP